MKNCKVIGCNDKHFCKGFCCKHYNQHRRGTLTAPTIDSLLEQLKQYESMIHHYATTTNNKTREFFILLESIIES